MLTGHVFYASPAIPFTRVSRNFYASPAVTFTLADSRRAQKTRRDPQILAQLCQFCSQKSQFREISSLIMCLSCELMRFPHELMRFRHGQSPKLDRNHNCILLLFYPITAPECQARAAAAALGEVRHSLWQKHSSMCDIRIAVTASSASFFDEVGAASDSRGNRPEPSGSE